MVSGADGIWRWLVSSGTLGLWSRLVSGTGLLTKGSLELNGLRRLLVFSGLTGLSNWSWKPTGIRTGVKPLTAVTHQPLLCET